MSQSRYKKFQANGAKTFLVPFIKIPKRSSDYYVYYDSSKHRMDTLSSEYYGDPNYGWLILQANPTLDGLEFDIPTNYLLRIPYPLQEALTQYNADVDAYNKYYGLN